MVQDKAGLPKPLPFLRALGMETVWRPADSQCGGGSRWGKNSPAAEELFFLSCSCWGWGSGDLTPWRPCGP